MGQRTTFLGIIPNYFESDRSPPHLLSRPCTHTIRFRGPVSLKGAQRWTHCSQIAEAGVHGHLQYTVWLRNRLSEGGIRDIERELGRRLTLGF